jgi:hypothetical protein
MEGRYFDRLLDSGISALVQLVPRALCNQVAQSNFWPVPSPKSAIEDRVGKPVWVRV